MKNNIIRSKNPRGFTLIEILIVITIIGITLSFALLAFGDFGSKRRVEIAAQQFVNYIKLAQQQSLHEGSVLSVNIQPKQYQLRRFKPPSSWQTLPKQGLFRPRVFPKNTTVTLETFSGSRTPQIIIQASGNMTPFALYFKTNETEAMIKITGYDDGSMTIQHLNNTFSSTHN